MVERSHAQAPNPNVSQTGKGRGLRSPSPPHPGGRARARVLLQQVAPNPPGLARASSRTLGLANFLEPPCASSVPLFTVFVPMEIFPVLDYLMSLPLKTPQGSPQPPYQPIPQYSIIDLAAGHRLLTECF